MRKIYLFAMTLLGSVACDENADDRGSDELAAGVAHAEALAEVYAPDAELPTVPLDAPEELEMDDWSEFDVTDDSAPAAGPPGKYCCVNCADGWSGWWNRGKGDACNQNGAKWCHDHNWNFLNAEWFTHCPQG